MQLEHNLEDSLAAPYLTYPILDPATATRQDWPRYRQASGPPIPFLI